MAAPAVTMLRLRTCMMIRSNISRGVFSRFNQLISFPQKEKLVPPIIERFNKTGFIRFFLLSIPGLNIDAPSTQSSENEERKEPQLVAGSSGGAHRFNASKTFELDDPKLSSSQCLKNAVGLAVDATSAVLSQIVYQLIDSEQQYVELVDVLITLLEYQLKVLGHEAEEQRMGDLILEARHEITEVHKRKQDLSLIFSSAEKLADATAEVAYASGSEYASVSSSERLHSALLEVKKIRQRSQEAEGRLHLAQVKVIEVVSKYDEQRKKMEAEKPPEKSEVAEGGDAKTEEKSFFSFWDSDKKSHDKEELQLAQAKVNEVPPNSEEQKENTEESATQEVEKIATQKTEKLDDCARGGEAKTEEESFFNF
ncbi:unnamed protein product [Lymnaea stagnalis]|uniref:Direct IAP-binding protein with low pI n=1 Tax=Lymnaea stagnalis TaxID=6523 RepID=A0AAV2IPR7_LYMST